MAVKSTLPEHVNLKLSDDRTNLVGSAELKEAEMAMLNHKAKLARLGGELK